MWGPGQPDQCCFSPPPPHQCSLFRNHQATCLSPPATTRHVNKTSGTNPGPTVHFHTGSPEIRDLTLYVPPGWTLPLQKGQRLEELRALPGPPAFNLPAVPPPQGPQCHLRCIHP